MGSVRILPVLKRSIQRTSDEFQYRVDSPHPIRDHAKAGDILPLARGAGGRVLMVYSGAKGALYDKVRKCGLMPNALARLTSESGARSVLRACRYRVP